MISTALLPAFGILLTLVAIVAAVLFIRQKQRIRLGYQQIRMNAKINRSEPKTANSTISTLEQHNQNALLYRSKIISIFNINGGVGKTTSAVNIAHQIAKMGHRVLLWDMDPQAASSFYLNINTQLATKLEESIDDMEQAKEQRKIRQGIVASGYPNLDVLPGDLSFRFLDNHVANAKLGNQFIKRFLAPFRQEYDYIIVDCPPGLSVSVESLLNASEEVLVPTVPTPVSARMFAQLQQFISNDIPSKPKMTGFFSMYNAQKNLHTDMLEQLTNDYPGTMSSITIPYSSDIEKMGVEQKPLAEFAENNPANAVFKQLALKLTSNRRSSENVSYPVHGDRQIA